MKLTELKEAEQLDLFKVPKPKRGDIISIDKDKEGNLGLKVRGIGKGLLGIGDLAEVRTTGYNLEITEIKNGKIRLDDGKYYAPKQLRYPMD